MLVTDKDGCTTRSVEWHAASGKFKKNSWKWNKRERQRDRNIEVEGMVEDSIPIPPVSIHKRQGRNHVFKVGVQFLGLGYCTEQNTQFRGLQSVT